MPAKRTQRKFRTKRRKVGRKSRRVKKRLIGGGKYSLKKSKEGPEITSDAITNIDSINGASFYIYDEKIYDIKIENNEFISNENTKKNYKSVSWVFTTLNKGSFGFNNTNIKNFLKKELPMTHTDYFQTLEEISFYHSKDTKARLSSQQDKSLIQKFMDRIGTEIEEIFKKINYSMPLEVRFFNNTIKFIQDKEVGKITYFKNEEFIKNNIQIDPKIVEGYITMANNNKLKLKEEYLNITDRSNIKNMDKEIILYYQDKMKQ
jgi:hypothetical protein